MEKWLKIGRFQVQEILNHDPQFNQLLARLEQSEVEYHRVMEKLTPEDRQIVETYIGLCEEVEYQKTHTAYKCGRMLPK